MKGPESLERCDVIKYVAENIEQFAAHRRGVDGKIGSRIPHTDQLAPGDDLSVPIGPVLSFPLPHAVSVVAADAQGRLYASSPKFHLRKWIVPCQIFWCWRVWIYEIDGDPPLLPPAPQDYVDEAREAICSDPAARSDA